MVKEHEVITLEDEEVEEEEPPKSEEKTKTVHVQCDGPEWTPVVLSTHVRLRVERALRGGHVTKKHAHGHKKRSMVGCLANSEGFVAEQPTKLGREERALQV